MARTKTTPRRPRQFFYAAKRKLELMQSENHHVLQALNQPIDPANEAKKNGPSWIGPFKFNKWCLEHHDGNIEEPSATAVVAEAEQANSAQERTLQLWNDPAKQVKILTFAKGRWYGMKGNLGKLYFTPSKSVKEAVEALEQYLSQPLDNEYLKPLLESEDLFYPDQDLWDAKMLTNPTLNRGSCLGDAVYLERIEVDNGKMTYSCGS